MSGPTRYRPASDGPARDLRRGLLRSAPFVFLAAFALFGSTAAGVAAITFCLGWVPLTVLEGWATRRPLSRARTAGTIALTWALVWVAVFGCGLQHDYLRGLTRGGDPAQAIGGLAPIAWPWPELAAATVFLCVLLSTLVLTRSLQGSESTMELLCATPCLQVLAVVVGAGLLDPSFETGLLAATAVLVVFPVLGLPLLIFLYALTEVLDRLEARWWPLEPTP